MFFNIIDFTSMNFLSYPGWEVFGEETENGPCEMDAITAASMLRKVKTMDDLRDHFITAVPYYAFSILYHEFIKNKELSIKKKGVKDEH